MIDQLTSCHDGKKIPKKIEKPKEFNCHSQKRLSIKNQSHSDCKRQCAAPFATTKEKSSRLLRADNQHQACQEYKLLNDIMQSHIRTLPKARRLRLKKSTQPRSSNDTPTAQSPTPTSVIIIILSLQWIPTLTVVQPQTTLVAHDTTTVYTLKDNCFIVSGIYMQLFNFMHHASWIPANVLAQPEGSRGGRHNY